MEEHRLDAAKQESHDTPSALKSTPGGDLRPTNSLRNLECRCIAYNLCVLSPDTRARRKPAMVSRTVLRYTARTEPLERTPRFLPCICRCLVLLFGAYSNLPHVLECTSVQRDLSNMARAALRQMP